MVETEVPLLALRAGIFLIGTIESPWETVASATVNKKLRYIGAALRVAVDYGFIDRVPKIVFVEQPQKIPTSVPPEHFAAIYRACDIAYLPGDIPNVPASDWWQTPIVTIYMTG